MSKKRNKNKARNAQEPAKEPPKSSAAAPKPALQAPPVAARPPSVSAPAPPPPPVAAPAPTAAPVAPAAVAAVSARPPRPAAATEPVASETRSHKRLPFEVELTIVSEHNFYAGLTLNVSEGGVFVATHVHHPVGTRLEIRLVFPGDEDPTSIMTEVRWVRLGRNAGDSTPGMGLRFVDVAPPVFDKIARFAKHREPLYYEDD